VSGPFLSRREALGALSSLLLVREGSASTVARVRVGLERLDSDEGRSLRGRRVGLLAHGASVDGEGRHAIDVLREAGIEVARVFAPEHGLLGHAAAGEPVEGGRDPRSGLPVVSLYGARHAPAAEDLAGLQTLVVDLQDAGVRFYTYVSTMLLCLDPVARARVEMVVLDRPDPLGGVYVAGPERDPSRPFRLVSVAPGPLVHGLTIGEMALLASARRTPAARVRVVRMAGWTRSMTWGDTGRPWVPPSPNLRSADAALVYPGTCLLEGTNVTEGRGTDQPFLLLGSPWLRAQELVREVVAPGIALEPCTFTPQPSEAAPRPKYSGERCQGVRVRVVDAAAVRSWELGLALLSTMRALHPRFAWLGEGAVLDGLLGTGTVRAALDRGEPVPAILAAEREAVRRFERERRESLLY